MQFIYDYFPIACFFITYKIAGIYWATGIGIIATFIQVAVYYIQHKKVEKVQIIILISIVVLGGLTIMFHQPKFIEWKPSVVYWVFAVLLLGSMRVKQKRPLLEILLGSKLELPMQAWRILTKSWGIYFLLMGFINIYVAYEFTLTQWVYFKLFGTLGLSIVMIIAQGVYIYFLTKNHPQN